MSACPETNNPDKCACFPYPCDHLETAKELITRSGYHDVVTAHALIDIAEQLRELVLILGGDG